MFFWGSMTCLANAASSRHAVWTYSETHSFMLRRVSFSVSVPTLFMDSDISSVSLIAMIRSICAFSASFFACCLASHSAFLLASAASCSARFLSSDSSSASEFSSLFFSCSASSSGSMGSSVPSVSEQAPSSVPSHAPSETASSWAVKEDASGSSLSESKGLSSNAALSVNPSRNPFSSFLELPAGIPPSSKRFSSILISISISINALLISDLLSSKTAWSG